MSSQLLALPASGRAWIRFDNKILLRRGKCLKMSQNPTCRVHALLGTISRVINLLFFNLTHHQELEDVRLREYLCKHHHSFGIRSRPPVHIRYQY